MILRQTTLGPTEIATDDHERLVKCHDEEGRRHCSLNSNAGFWLVVYLNNSTVVKIQQTTNSFNGFKNFLLKPPILDGNADDENHVAAKKKLSTVPNLKL